MDPGKFSRERFHEAARVGVVTGEGAVLGHDRVDRADRLGQRVDTVEMRHHGLLVRHGDIAPAPCRIGAASREIIRQTAGGDEGRAIGSVDAALA